MPCLRDCDGYPHRRIRGRRDRRCCSARPRNHRRLPSITCWTTSSALRRCNSPASRLERAGTCTPALSHVRRNDHGRGCQVPILRCRLRSPTPGSFVAWRPKLPGVHDCGSGGAHQADQESLHGLVVVPCSRDWVIIVGVIIGIGIVREPAIAGLAPCGILVILAGELRIGFCSTSYGYCPGSAHSDHAGTGSRSDVCPMLQYLLAVRGFLGSLKDLNRWRKRNVHVAAERRAGPGRVDLQLQMDIPYAVAVGVLAGMIISISMVKGMCETAVQSLRLSSPSFEKGRTPCRLE